MQRRQSLVLLGASLWVGWGAVAHAYRPPPARYRNALAAASGQLLSVEVLSQQRHQQQLPIFQKNGRWYVGGEHGQPYRLLLRNQSAGRLLVVASVDGVNVLNGEPAAADQPGYIIAPYGSLTIDGWRKSSDSVAEFVLTAPEDSYAERTGQGGNTGILGFAVFEEAPPPPPPPRFPPPAAIEEGYHRRESSKSIPAAPSAGGRSLDHDNAPVAAKAPAAAERSDLGTGHGERVHSPVREVRFQRASRRPAETLRIQYASLAQLERRRIALRERWPERQPPDNGPDPFPGEGRFVPDPPPRR